MNIQIICILSFLFHGNVDVIELIYKKKMIIEYNETILHYLLNGLHSGKLYSYNISALEEKESMINLDNLNTSAKSSYKDIYERNPSNLDKVLK